MKAPWEKMKSKQRPRGHAGARPREETVGQMQAEGPTGGKGPTWRCRKEMTQSWEKQSVTGMVERRSQGEGSTW